MVYGTISAGSGLFLRGSDATPRGTVTRLLRLQEEA